jgi:hypothetical protein
MVNTYNNTLTQHPIFSEILGFRTVSIVLDQGPNRIGFSLT